MIKVYGKNGFADVSKNVAKYISEDKFVWIIKVSIGRNIGY